jgi:hypothetical protein
MFTTLLLYQRGDDFKYLCFIIVERSEVPPQSRIDSSEVDAALGWLRERAERR